MCEYICDKLPENCSISLYLPVIAWSVSCEQSHCGALWQRQGDNCPDCLQQTNFKCVSVVIEVVIVFVVVVVIVAESVVVVVAVVSPPWLSLKCSMEPW